MIDLHTHTTYSDGEFELEQFFEIAKTQGVTVLSVTDHDSIEACKVILQNKMVPKNVTFIPGVEISAVLNGIKMHIVGLNVDVFSENLNKHAQTWLEDRKKRAFEILEIIEKDLKIKLNRTPYNVRVKNNQVVGRWHITLQLANEKHFESFRDASKYVSKAADQIKGPFDTPAKEAIAIIKAAGGIPVLAHPDIIIKKYGINNEQLLALVKELKSFGLQGIEVYHKTASVEQQKLFADIAIQNKLLVSTGSDFHGPLNRREFFGGYDNIEQSKITVLNNIKLKTHN